MKHHVSKYCKGEKCYFRKWPGDGGGCLQPAMHKVAEEIFDDEPLLFAGQVVPGGRHPLTQYVCCQHFSMIMGPAAACGHSAGAAAMSGRDIRVGENPTPGNPAALAAEAKAWDEGRLKPTDPGWYDAPEALPSAVTPEELALRTEQALLWRRCSKFLLEMVEVIAQLKEKSKCGAVWRAGILRVDGSPPDGARCTLLKHGPEVDHKWR